MQGIHHFGHVDYLSAGDPEAREQGDFVIGVAAEENHRFWFFNDIVEFLQDFFDRTGRILVLEVGGGNRDGDRCPSLSIVGIIHYHVAEKCAVRDSDFFSAQQAQLGGA